MAIDFSKSNLRKPSVSDSDAIGHLTPVNFDRLTDLRIARVPCRTRSEYQSEITKLWDHAKQSFLMIGRYLNEAKATLVHGEYQKLIDRELPFGRSQAFQFRAIASMVDAGKLLEQELPASASIAYELTKLQPLELEDARQKGLLHGSVTRSEIRTWRRSQVLQGSGSASDETRGRLREGLQRRISRLEAELQEAREALQQLELG